MALGLIAASKRLFEEQVRAACAMTFPEGERRRVERSLDVDVERVVPVVGVGQLRERVALHHAVTMGASAALPNRTRVGVCCQDQHGA